MENKLAYTRRAAALVLVLSAVSVGACATTRQEHVHRMGHSVMPFDVSKVVHVFEMTETGGVMRVLARDPGATRQITLIQQHLADEAARFQQGDYGDPAKLHGADMPGLADLEASAAGIRVTYSALPAGGEITFKTTDLHLLTAVHRWFGAQLSEHGADARAE
jgi:hypothetical protein